MKEFISKLPVFIFCVLFISGYNHLFGPENNIIAVVILTGLFIFMRGDLGYKTIQATFAIIVLYLLMPISATIALMNPFWGLAVNFITIMLMLILSCHDLTQGNHVPFLMGYLFCQGYDVKGDAFANRMISMCIGAVLIAVIYYLINRKKEYRRTMKDLFKELNIHSTRTEWYIRMSVTLTITLFIGEILQYPRIMWIALAVLSLTTPFEDEHYGRSRARIPAAILGTVLFYVLFVCLIPEQFQPIIVLIAGFAAMFIQNYFIKSIYNSFSALGTAVILFPTADALQLRVLSNIIGTVVALASYYLFRQLFKRIRTKENEQEAME